jgi:hypothetical protein
MYKLFDNAPVSAYYTRSSLLVVGRPATFSVIASSIRYFGRPLRGLLMGMQYFVSQDSSSF